MKLFFGLFGVLVISLGYSYWAGIDGPVADQIVSGWASRQTGFQVKAFKSKVRRWRDVQFESLSIAKKEVLPDRLLLTGRGSFRFTGFLWKPRAIRVRLENIEINGEAGQNLFAQLGFLADKSLPSKLSGKADFLLFVSGQNLRIRGIRIDSESIRLFGGVDLINKQLTKAQIIFFLSKKAYGNIPAGITKKLSHRGDGWIGGKIFFILNQITVKGARGPLLQFAWQ